jgi:hypothetical protein
VARRAVADAPPPPLSPDAVNAVLGLPLTPRSARLAAVVAGEASRIRAVLRDAPDSADALQTAEHLLTLLEATVVTLLEPADGTPASRPAAPPSGRGAPAVAGAGLAGEIAAGREIRRAAAALRATARAVRGRSELARGARAPDGSG